MLASVRAAAHREDSHGTECPNEKHPFTIITISYFYFRLANGNTGKQRDAASKIKSYGGTMANNKYRDGRWSVPGKRAKGYAEERKAKVHKWGDKEGKELTDYEAGMRSGYLQCQRDHGGMFKYGQARDAGFSKQEAGAMSKKPWKEIKDTIEKAKKSKGGK